MSRVDDVDDARGEHGDDPAFLKFETIRGFLRDDAACALEHFELERYMRTEGFELLRLASHMNFVTMSGVLESGEHRGHPQHIQVHDAGDLGALANVFSWPALTTGWRRRSGTRT